MTVNLQSVFQVQSGLEVLSLPMIPLPQSHQQSRIHKYQTQLSLLLALKNAVHVLLNKKHRHRPLKRQSTMKLRELLMWKRVSYIDHVAMPGNSLLQRTRSWRFVLLQTKMVDQDQLPIVLMLAPLKKFQTVDQEIPVALFATGESNEHCLIESIEEISTFNTYLLTIVNYTYTSPPSLYL